MSRRSKIAYATQLVGDFPHYNVRQAAERPEQPPAIDRAGLIDHHFAGARIACHPLRQLNPQHVPAG
jgi:hypothetical protein